jgi:hypothetical protein
MHVIIHHTLASGEGASLEMGWGNSSLPLVGRAYLGHRPCVGLLDNLRAEAGEQQPPRPAEDAGNLQSRIP